MTAAKLIEGDFDAMLRLVDELRAVLALFRLTFDRDRLAPSELVVVVIGSLVVTVFGVAPVCCCCKSHMLQ